MADRKVVWTTKLVENAIERMNDGFILKTHEVPFFEKTIGLRKAHLTFSITTEEFDEYVKCASDIHYFAENYCYIKGEDGHPIIIPLRDYQEEILDNFFNHRYNILMASRQIGKCIEYNTSLLIYDKRLEVYKNIKFFQLLFRYKSMRTAHDYIKYVLYSFLNFID